MDDDVVTLAVYVYVLTKEIHTAVQIQLYYTFNTTLTQRTYICSSTFPSSQTRRVLGLFDMNLYVFPF